MLTCKNITMKVISAFVNRLSVSEKLSIKLHLMMCKSCRNFSNQMQVIESVSEAVRYNDLRADNKISVLSDESRERIKRKLFIR